MRIADLLCDILYGAFVLKYNFKKNSFYEPTSKFIRRVRK